MDNETNLLFGPPGGDRYRALNGISIYLRAVRDVKRLEIGELAHESAAQIQKTHHELTPLATYWRSAGVLSEESNDI